MEAMQGNSNLTPDQMQVLADLLATTSSASDVPPNMTSLLSKDEGSAATTDKLVEVINPNGQPQYVLTSQPNRSAGQDMGGSYTMAK